MLKIKKKKVENSKKLPWKKLENSSNSKFEEKNQNFEKTKNETFKICGWDLFTICGVTIFDKQAKKIIRNSKKWPKK